MAKFTVNYMESKNVEVSDMHIYLHLKNKILKGKDYKVGEDGFVYKYECTNYHRDDYDYVKSHVASEVELRDYNLTQDLKTYLDLSK